MMRVIMIELVVMSVVVMEVMMMIIFMVLFREDTVEEIARGIQLVIPTHAARPRTRY